MTARMSPGTSAPPVADVPGTTSSPPANPPASGEDTGAAAAWAGEARVAAAPRPLQAELAQVARQMLEKVLQERVRRIARELGLLYYHTHLAKHSPAGFPDCVFLTATGRIAYAELKREGQRPSPEQQRWLDALALTGAPVWVWRPTQLLDGTVARALAQLAGWVAP